MGSSREAATREATPSTATRTRARGFGGDPPQARTFPARGFGGVAGGRVARGFGIGAGRRGSERVGESGGERGDVGERRAIRRGVGGGVAVVARRREPPVRVRVEVHDASRGEETVTRRVPLARHEHRATRVRAPGRGGSSVLAREVREALDALVAVRARVVRHHHEARRALVGRDGVAEATQSAVHRVQGDGATAATGRTEEGRRRARPRDAASSRARRFHSEDAVVHFGAPRAIHRGRSRHV